MDTGPHPGKRATDRDGLHRRRTVWYFGYRDPATHRWHEISTATTSHVEARHIRAEKMLELNQGLLQSDKIRLRLSTAFEDWLEDASLHYRPSTVRLHKERSKPLLAYLGAMKLAEISLDTVRSYQRMRSKAVSGRTVNMEVQTLRNVMKHFGLWRGRIREDYKCLPENRNSIGRVLSEEEELRCWKIAQSSQFCMRTYNLSVLLGNTGLRRSELLGLRLEQVDLERAEIWVSRSKTNAGRRFIPLNEHALVAAAMVFELAKCKGAHLPDHFLFPAYLHTRRHSGEERSGYDPEQHQKTFRTAWRNFTRKCGLKGLRAHDRRHHFVTLLAESDVPPEAAMAIVGHMSHEMLRHYTHIRDGLKRIAVGRIDAANAIGTDELKQGIAALSKMPEGARMVAKAGTSRD